VSQEGHQRPWHWAPHSLHGDALCGRLPIGIRRSSGSRCPYWPVTASLPGVQSLHPDPQTDFAPGLDAPAAVYREEPDLDRHPGGLSGLALAHSGEHGLWGEHHSQRLLAGGEPAATVVVAATAAGGAAGGSPGDCRWLTYLFRERARGRGPCRNASG